MARELRAQEAARDAVREAARDAASKELMASNFMEALLRAALILGDRRRFPPVNEIYILSVDARTPNRQPRAQCRIIMEPAAHVPPNERVRIVYPERSRRLC